jgi:tRNA threonylcarbamoyl adenosine modification protein YjeE
MGRMSGSWTLDLADADATRRLGAAVGAALEPGLVVALSGDLGAGKTALAKAATAAQGAVEEDDVSSPTFVLAVDYPGRVPILHVDAYRLDSAAAFETLGFGPLERLDQAVLLEWPEKVPGALPDDRLEVALSHADPGRKASLNARGPRSRAALEKIRASLR